MLRISDRQKREMLYGPTNEEQITEIFRSSVKSYKLLPQIFYHIQWKFRDELRPRFGVMRCREFYMKDAYSFDLSENEAVLSYNKMFYAYLKTFQRLGLQSIPMKADTGPIGGDLSHEFVILADTGESRIYSDKRIFDINISEHSPEDSSIKQLREKYDTFYAVTDDKFSKDDFEKKGLIFSALSPDGTLPEIIELKDHPWFVGVQFHPEFKSRPFTPHPLFSSFIKAAGNFRRKK